MDGIKRTWKQVPSPVRRTLVFILGTVLIICAAILGPVPGPGGTVVFLLGIAVLATEFTWAERLRDYLFQLFKRIIAYAKRRPLQAGLIGLSAVVVLAAGGYALYTFVL